MRSLYQRHVSTVVPGGIYKMINVPVFSPPGFLHTIAISQLLPAFMKCASVMEWIWESSTRKKRNSKMNKHKLKKRRKLMRRNTKASRS